MNVTDNAQQTKPIRILIVEDHQMFAEGIEKLLAGHEHISVIQHVKSRKEALEALRENVEIDLVLMDLFLGKAEDHEEPEGLKTIRDINQEINKQSAKKVKIIIVSSAIDGKWISKAKIRLGVWGYVSKDKGAKALEEAIERVHKGKVYYEDEVREALDLFDTKSASMPEEPVYLTPTEREIIRLISQGFKSEDIAGFRKCKVGTIETHRTNILKKLGAANAANMVSIAKDKGFI